MATSLTRIPHQLRTEFAGCSNGSAAYLLGSNRSPAMGSIPSGCIGTPSSHCLGTRIIFLLHCSSKVDFGKLRSHDRPIQYVRRGDAERGEQSGIVGVVGIYVKVSESRSATLCLATTVQVAEKCANSGETSNAEIPAWAAAYVF